MMFPAAVFRRVAPAHIRAAAAVACLPFVAGGLPCCPAAVPHSCPYQGGG